jgi:hypothetical protein
MTLRAFRRSANGDVWRRVHERLEQASGWFARMQKGGKLLGRPSFEDSQYLLTGFSICAACEGAVATISRMHGTAPNRRQVHFYGCTVNQRRGEILCSNRTIIKHDVMDRALLASITELLEPTVIQAAVEEALARLQEPADFSLRERLEREIGLLDARVDRLLDALADGTGGRDEIVVRIKDSKKRKSDLAAELADLIRAEAFASVDLAELRPRLEARVNDVRALLGRHVPQARQMLRKLIWGTIQMEPIAEGRRRGYRFRGAIRIDRLLTGEALEELAISWWPQREVTVRGALSSRSLCRSRHKADLAGC